MQPSPLARILFGVYVALAIYASLYPLEGWRDHGLSPFAYFASPWPRYVTGFDLVANVLGYLPYGFLCIAALRPGVRGAAAFAVVLASAAALSLVLPGWGIFLLGMGVIILSFNLFDRCLPKMTLKESQVGSLATFVFRPGVMFLLGAAVTTMSMSVSVSLSILVPLNDRGFIRRENVIPYIMGANITTFIDTLIASVLLGNPHAFTVVLAEMTSITIVSLIVLIIFYHPFERAMLDFVSWITRENRHLYLFMAVIIVAPIILLFV